MPCRNSIHRYRWLYKKLLHIYPKQYRDRFTVSMQQTFNDLLRERAGEEKRLLGFAVWMIIETSAVALRERITYITMRNKNILRIALVTVSILMIPLVGMQFSDKDVWTVYDFVIAGVLLFGAGLGYELVSRKGGSFAYRTAVGIGCATGLLLVWANLAVGIIGSDDNPANALYLGVIAVGLIGVAIARFDPRRMSHAMFATAITQALVPVVALIIWQPPLTIGVLGVFLANGLFVALWLVSGLLFRRAITPPSGRNSKDGIPV